MIKVNEFIFLLWGIYSTQTLQTLPEGLRGCERKKGDHRGKSVSQSEYCFEGIIREPQAVLAFTGGGGRRSQPHEARDSSSFTSLNLSCILLSSEIFRFPLIEKGTDPTVFVFSYSRRHAGPRQGGQNSHRVEEKKALEALSSQLGGCCCSLLSLTLWPRGTVKLVNEGEILSFCCHLFL